MKSKKLNPPEYVTNLQRSARIVRMRMVDLCNKIEREGLNDESAIANAFMIVCTQIGDLAADIDRAEELRTQAHIAELKKIDDLNPSPFFVSRF